jgi:hypothetical protein
MKIVIFKNEDNAIYMVVKADTYMAQWGELGWAEYKKMETENPLLLNNSYLEYHGNLRITEEVLNIIDTI